MKKRSIRNKHIPLLALGLCLTGGMMGAFVMGAMADETEEVEGIFDLTPVARLYVYVDDTMDGELGGRLEAGSVVTLEAPEVEGKNFQYWALGSEDGPVASYLEQYRLAVNTDTTLYAVYSDETQEELPAAAFTSVQQWKEYNGDEAIRLTTTFSVPDDMEVSDAGIIYTDNRLLGVAGNDNLTEDYDGGPNVEALLTGGDSRRLRRISASNEGAVTVFDEGTEATSGSSGTQPSWSIEAGDWNLNQADWTLTLQAPGGDAPVYAVAYMTVDGETVYSDVMTAVYNKLDSVSLVYTPSQADEYYNAVDGTSGTVPDAFEAAISAAIEAQLGSGTD